MHSFYNINSKSNSSTSHTSSSSSSCKSRKILSSSSNACWLSYTPAAVAFTLCLFLTTGPVSVSEGRQVALPGPQCHPSVINTMPPRIRQICKALETIWEFNDTMEDYLDEKDLMVGRAPETPSRLYGQRQQLVHQQAQQPDPMEAAMERRPLWTSGVKRQTGPAGEDVEHVFLRFGKRG